MINESIMLRGELDAFWVWAHQQHGDRAEALLGGEWADDYPRLGMLYEATAAVVGELQNVPCTDEVADLLLEAIAIDNEGEHVLDICSGLPDSALDCLFRRAVVCRLPDARWQMASLIGEIGDAKWVSYLQVFINDQHEYVERRALLALENVDPTLAEEAAINRIGHHSDYMRLAAVSVLINLHSPKLTEVRSRLISDPFVFVREKANEIADGG